MKEYEEVIHRHTMKKRTISLPETLLAQGLLRARQDSRNFSSYVQKLIQRDMEGALQVPTAVQEARDKAEADRKQKELAI